MRLKITLSGLLAAFSFCLKAQITVTTNDFAAEGDSVWMTTAMTDNSLSYQAGGANKTWDFSTLRLSSQTCDIFIPTLFTNPTYAFYYSNIPFNPNRANIAVNEANPPSIPVISITDVYNFYYKNNSSYVQRGIGESIAGVPTNVAYNSPDTLYTFPLQYQTTSASTSGYSLSLPTLLYYGYGQTRTNNVDGWGQVTTPYGTFQALRMVSEITSFDSIYVDTFHFGFKLPMPVQHQYKWIANGQLEPVVQINTTVILGSRETINSIVYRDTLHPVVSGISSPVGNSSISFTVFPNPASNDLNIGLNRDISHGTYAVYDIDGRMIQSGPMQVQTQHLNTSNWARGTYIVTVTSAKETAMRKVVVH